MNFDSNYFGPEGLTAEDRNYRGSRYADVKSALYRNAYYRTWGNADAQSLPVYGSGLRQSLRGFLTRPWAMLEAARRTIHSAADLRWGPDGKGFRRILHPNGICLFGAWEIDDNAPSQYSGYFAPGKHGLIIGRYSTAGAKVYRGQTRSLSLVGKIYPTTDENHAESLRPANFFTQQDIGGEKTLYVNDAVFLNAPNVTPWRRGLGLPAFIATITALRLADTNIGVRQLYQIAELGKAESAPTEAPGYMRISMANSERIYGDDLDFRDEILSIMYDKGNPKPQRPLIFNIEVTDTARSVLRPLPRRIFENWKKIGRIVLREAIASYNGDYVLHFQHPPWRNNHNDPKSQATKGAIAPWK